MQRVLYPYLVLFGLALCSTNSWSQGSVDIHDGAWQYTFQIEEINSYPEFKQQHDLLFGLFDAPLQWNEESHRITVFSFNKFNEEYFEEWLEEEDLNLLEFDRE